MSAPQRVAIRPVSRHASSGRPERAHRGSSLARYLLSPRVSELLKITQLIGVLEIFDSLEEGLSSFS